MAAKSELLKLEAGEVLLDKGQTIQHVYLVKSGCVQKEMSGGNSRRLMVGDLFGERMLLGRSKSEARYTAEDDVELFRLSPNHLAAVWESDPRTNCSFWGHVALLYAVELRGQSLGGGGGGGGSSSNNNVKKKNVSDRLTRLTMAGLRYSTVLNEEEVLAVNQHHQQQLQMQQEQQPGSKPVFSGADEPVIVERECLLKKREGRVLVTATEVRFEGAGRLGFGSKTVSIPYESIERMSTSVPDDVVRGKKLVSKVYNKRGPYHSVTLTVRQRKNK